MSEDLKADAIIVGGGLMGAASAFFLRKRGRSVILLERGLVGQQASGVNFGNVRRQGRYLPQLPLAHRSRAIWGQMKDLLGDDAEFLPTGHVRGVYDEAQAAVVEQYAKDARGWGLELELVGGSAFRRRFPFFGPEVICGSYSPADGHANPRLAAPAFGRAAARAGARVIENCEVLTIDKEGEDFRVQAADGRCFRAPSALICAGAWGDRLSAAFGEPVPLTPHGPSMGVTEPMPYGIVPVVGVSTKVAHEVVYFRQVKRGNIVFGGGLRGPAYPELQRAYVLPENLLRQLRELRRLAPALGKLQVLRTWSGIEGYMRDELPVMGPSGRISGLYYAFGFCGHGFQLGPGVGDVMAELIDTGATTTPIEPFHIRRFAASSAAAPSTHRAAAFATA
ncbi:sarcosine oxidase subunit beta [Variovorax paradoxus]|uniref:NAD(P)/FAD-dependent oxidoreductase n=1 Tax=Variovorax paradoxus TaxID=34073 RepID=UPI00278779AF|nr:FAD-binding oxidoreductase [Variovorax paradoxus]MDQ0027181.1 sarcosine oxidase subunit beta [Variovorax paradoxus]